MFNIKKLFSDVLRATATFIEGKKNKEAKEKTLKFKRKPKPYTDPILAGKLYRARAAKLSASKYTPHQGKQECARRKAKLHLV